MHHETSTFWIPHTDRDGGLSEEQSKTQLANLVYNVIYNSPVSLDVNVYINDRFLRAEYRKSQLLGDLIEQGHIFFLQQSSASGPKTLPEIAEYMHQSSGRIRAFSVDNFLDYTDLLDITSRARIEKYDHNEYSEAYTTGILSLFSSIVQSDSPIIPPTLATAIYSCIYDQYLESGRVRWSYVDRDDNLGVDVTRRLNGTDLWREHRNTISEIAGAPAYGFYVDTFGPSAAYFEEHARSISLWRRPLILESETFSVLEIKGGARLDVNPTAILALTAGDIDDLVRSKERIALDLSKSALSESSDSHVDFRDAYEMYRRKIEDYLCRRILGQRPLNEIGRIRISGKKRAMFAAGKVAKESAVDIVVDSLLGVFSIPVKIGYKLIQCARPQKPELIYPKEFGSIEMQRREDIENVTERLSSGSNQSHAEFLKIRRHEFIAGYSETVTCD